MILLRILQCSFFLQDAPILYCKYFSDPCLEVNCGKHSKCQIEGTEAYCVCDEGWTYNPKEISAGCVGKSKMMKRNKNHKFYTWPREITLTKNLDGNK